jgi:hypothetical protein
VIYLDSLQPGNKRRLPVETAESEIHFYRNFLGKILSVIRISCDVPTIGYDPSLMTQK